MPGPYQDMPQRGDPLTSESETMDLTFWGVRGGIPVPGPDTVEVGGDTVCLDICASNGDDGAKDCRAVLDAGTGITNLGRSLLAGPAGKGQGEIHIFLTHTHWDHIQGFPYFIPAFIPGNKVYFWGRPVSDRSVHELLEGQMGGVYNPIFTLDNMGSTIEVNEMGEEPITFGKFTMRTIILPHAGSSSLGFRISDAASDVCFLGDVDYPDDKAPSDVIAFSMNTGVLVHDVGESLPEGSKPHVAVEIARRTGAAKVLLTHFAPTHTDEDVKRIVEAVRKSAGSEIEVDAARQGLNVTV